MLIRTLWVLVWMPFAAHAATYIVDTPPGAVPFPDGTVITDEYESYAVYFSADDSDLPPPFVAIGLIENRVYNSTFFNPFRLTPSFLAPFNRITVTLRDMGPHAQTHSLTAFDEEGNIIDEDVFEDGGAFPDAFKLSVSSATPISFVVVFDQPGGDVVLERVALTILPAVAASIDIKPRSETNVVNPLSRALIPVAILGSPGFDVTDVETAILDFGPARTRPAAKKSIDFDDVNDDGFTDLVAIFRGNETGIALGDSEACLEGEWVDGIMFQGCDSIVAAPACGLGFELVLLLPLLRRAARRRVPHGVPH